MSTLPLQIRNAEAALSILGDTCDYFQQIRELTENVADQARAYPNKKITCNWGYESGIYEKGFRFGDIEIPSNTYKLACVDNGPGMKEKTLTGPIRSLFNSGTGHENGNFGIGAKVAGLSRHASNSIGLLFITKTAGCDAVCAVLTSDGLIEHDVETDDEIEPWAVVPCKILGVKVPRIIEKAGHGTAVVMLGDTPDRDTVKPIQKVWEKLEGKKRVWLPQYITRRYMRFPNNLTVSGFEVGAKTQGASYYEGDGIKVTSRPARPFEEFLKHFKERSGTIKLKEANADWYIIKENSEKHTFTGHMMTAQDRSGLAVEWRNELYERETAAGLAKFGVYVGERRVFVVIRPDENIVSSNATRDALYIEGRAVRNDYMRDWAIQFRSKIKDTKLGEWLASQSHRQSGDSRNRLIDVLRKCGAQLKVKGFYLGQKESQVHVSVTPTGCPAVDPTQKGASSAHSGKNGNGDGSLNVPVTINPHGKHLGSPAHTDCAPDIIWDTKKSFNDSTRTPGVYAPTSENPLGILRLNKDFKFFGDLKRMLLESIRVYRKAQDFTEEQQLQICQNLVEHTVGCEMAEAILRAYQNAKTLGNKWSQESLEELFDEKTLTVMTLRSSTTVPYMVDEFRGNGQEWINVK